MGFFQDMMAIFKKRELALLESYEESEGVYTFLFEKGQGVTWKAGQHGLFTITHKKVKNGTKPFSIASAPAENAIQLTVGIGDSPSEFKQAMLELKPGMTITMAGPVGSFYPEDDSPALFIAGGIGITPFRSIVKQSVAEGSANKKPITLLYLDSKKSYLFREEFDEIASNTSIRIAYLDSRDGLQQEIDKFIDLYKSNGTFFVAGSKSMVNSISDELKNKHIAKRNIKKDEFYGY